MSTRRTFLMQLGATGLLTYSDQPKAAASTGTAPARITTYRIPKTELEVSRIAYGPYMLESVPEATRMIHAAHDSGITLFDVADMYKDGTTEAVLGTVLKQSPGLRDRIVLQSKSGIVMGEKAISGLNCSRDHLIKSVEGSLRRLGTDRLDILLMHWPDALTAPEEVASAFDELHRSGKVRYFGVSNHTSQQLELLQKFVRQRLVVNQIPLSLERSYLISGHLAPLWHGSPYAYSAAAATLDYCQLHDVQVQAWSPLRGNLLKSSADAPPESKQASTLLSVIAKRKAAHPSAVALSWLLHHQAGIVPIIGTTKIEHLLENCAADRLSLSRDEWYSLVRATLGIGRTQPGG
jgi:predicted oxidoreductase